MLQLIAQLDPVTIKTLILMILVFVAFGIAILVYEARKKVIDHSLRKRYFIWYIMAPILLLPLYLGGFVFGCLSGALALYCQREFFQVVHVWEAPLYRWLGRVCGGATVAAAFYVSSNFSGPFPLIDPSFYHHIVGPPASQHALNLFYVLPAFIIMLILAAPVLLDQYEGMVLKGCLTIFGFMYFSWFLGHLVLLRDMSNGLDYTLFLIVIVIFNDTAAYAAGRLWGKTSLSPTISPKKTREGTFTAVVGCMLLALLYKDALPGLNLAAVLFAGLLISVAGTIGDLVISVVKRDMAVKDSGTLIPGHGGLLDRCDSLIFASPVFYYYLRLFGQT